MKKFNVIITAFLFYLMQNNVFGKNNLCEGINKYPCIVQDTQDNEIRLKHFRTANMLAKTYQGNITGLSKLWMSGGSAFSEHDWMETYKIIKKITNNKVKKIIDIDLRQESHGYLNNNAINLTGKNNWINFNKSKNAIVMNENHWLKNLKLQKKIIHVLSPQQFKTQQFNNGKMIVVKSIMDEKTLVKKIGFDYFRLTVPDHRIPSDDDVNRFVTLSKQIPRDTWLHIHCRGGDGRTTTFMTMYDMLKNADQVSFEEIIKRQAAVDPFYNLSIIERKHPEFNPYYKERLQFLKQFYQFSMAYLKGYSESWSTWKQKTSPLK